MSISLNGPPRLAPGESVQTLLLLTLLGISLWLLIPGFYASSLQASASQPATQGTVELSPRQAVTINIIDGSLVTAFLLVGSAILRPGGIRRMGLSLASLAGGVARGVMWSLVVVPLTFLVAIATDKFWKIVGLEHPGVHETLRLLREAREHSLQIAFAVSAILIAPVFEEVLFRGHIQTALAALFPVRERSSSAAKWLAIVLASILFTLIHLQLWMMPPIFFLSLCLGYLYERGGNLWTVIVVHMLFNATNVVLFVGTWPRS